MLAHRNFQIVLGITHIAVVLVCASSLLNTTTIVAGAERASGDDRSQSLSGSSSQAPPQPTYVYLTKMHDFQKGESYYSAAVAATNAKEGKIKIDKYVALDSCDTIDAAALRWLELLTETGETPNFAEKERKLAKTLRTLTWAKFSPLFKPGVKSIVIEADGVLSNVPWAALPGDKSAYLIQDYSIAFDSPYLRFETDKDACEIKRAMLIGGIDLSDNEWAELPGSGEQVRKIADLLNGRAEVTLLEGKLATTEMIEKRLVKSHLAHISARRVKLRRPKLDRLPPGLRAGSLEITGLAASNYKKSSGGVDKHLSDTDEGVLSSETIAALSLQDLCLVVLTTPAPHKTTLGSPIPQNFVYAFASAGARTIITPLWETNNAQTTQLMIEFYKNLFVHKLGKLDALLAAQLTMLEKAEQPQRDVGETNDQRYREHLRAWAPWVLVGDWR